MRNCQLFIAILLCFPLINYGQQNKVVHTGDTIYLLTPSAIVRKHFEIETNAYVIDSVANENAAKEVSFGIQLIGKKKLNVIETNKDRRVLSTFYNKIRSTMFRYGTDSVDLNFNFKELLNPILNEKERRHLLIICAMEWDYYHERAYGMLKAVYGRVIPRSGFYLTANYIGYCKGNKYENEPNIDGNFICVF